MKYTHPLFIFIIFAIPIWAQSPNYTSLNGHSHNDYAQKHPFKTAFEARMGSIEADVFLVGTELFVAHEKKDIKPENTLDNLYLKPLAEAVKMGKAYPMLLMIDIKTRGDSTLDEVIHQIARYADVFNDKSTVIFLISGNRPLPQKWVSYPSIIQFDGRPTENYTPEQWARVGLVSADFKKYTPEKDKKISQSTVFESMKKMVETAHAKGKKTRFWGTDDSKKVWKTLIKMGADFINTDKPKKLNAFLRFP
jgi:alkaline phosphatase